MSEPPQGQSACDNYLTVNVIVDGPQADLFVTGRRGMLALQFETISEKLLAKLQGFRDPGGHYKIKLEWHPASPMECKHK